MLCRLCEAVLRFTSNIVSQYRFQHYLYPAFWPLWRSLSEFESCLNSMVQLIYVINIASLLLWGPLLLVELDLTLLNNVLNKRYPQH